MLETRRQIATGFFMAHPVHFWSESPRIDDDLDEVDSQGNGNDFSRQTALSEAQEMMNNTILIVTILFIAGCSFPTAGDSDRRNDAYDGTSSHYVVVEGGIGGPATRGDWNSAVAEQNVYCGLDDVESDDIHERRDHTVPRHGWDVRQADEKGRCGDDFETLLFRLANCEREARSLPPLKCDLRLVWASREHSLDMYERQYFSHVNPEGMTPGQRLSARGISWRASGENLAMAPTMALGHSGWMESRGHRESILDARFTHFGIGVIKTKRGYVMTALFTGG